MLDPTASDMPVSRVDQTLRLLRSLGMAGVLGGLGALVAMWALSPQPTNGGEWRLLVTTMRSVFYACVFSGIVILVPVGSILWRRRRNALRGQRWFRTLLVILLVTIPGLHIGARLTSVALRQAVEANDATRAAELWNRLGWLFLIALLVFLIASWIATARPRLGSRLEH